jgi:hypothetical protein
MPHISNSYARAFRRTFVAYFHTLHYWPLDLIAGVLIAVEATPPVPFGLLWFAPVWLAWMAFRLWLARRLRNTPLSRAVALRIRRERAAADDPESPRRRTPTTREYFRSLRYWPYDLAGCFLAILLLTPADPFSLQMYFPPLVGMWICLRWLVALVLSQRDRD